MSKLMFLDRDGRVERGRAMITPNRPKENCTAEKIVYFSFRCDISVILVSIKSSDVSGSNASILVETFVTMRSYNHLKLMTILITF